MIAKHVPMRSLGKSDFAGLAEYITDAQSKTERLGNVAVTNCESGTVEAAIEEVLATQHMNTRAKGDKTYHLLVSLRAGEKPDADILKAIEERLCEGLGYAEHQRISAVHHDTDNLHIHLAINKIHPVRNTMHEPFQSYRTLADLCAVIERDYGLEADNHTATQTITEGRAADMERHAGVQSLLGWIKRECIDELTSAQSWAELHDALRSNGLALRPMGNGFVIEAGDGTQVKASTVARELSKPKLEARFGSFVAPPEQRARAKRQYDKPQVRMRADTTALYARYKADQQAVATTQKATFGKARQRKAERIEAAKRMGRLRRATIKLMGDNGANKRLLYAQASRALHEKIKEAHAAYQQERHGCYAGHTRRTWADWLKHEALHGNGEALKALRAREAAQGLKGDTVKGEGRAKPGYAPVMDNITKKGTIILRTGNGAVRDDGDKLQVSRGATRAGLQDALRLAMERYGDRITVGGTPTFQAQIIRAAVDARMPITFSNPALESRRQALSLKEQSHDREQPDRGRAGRSVGGDGSRPDGRTGGARRAGHDRADAGSGARRKPDVGRVGKSPPPQSQNRLRAMSECGVVRIAGGTDVLLPSDVPRELEQQGTQPANALRRGVLGTGITPEQLSSMDQYIAEREEKRLKGFDIPKHTRYNEATGTLAFVGVRNVDGHSLALVRRDDEVMVLPIDQATAKRLSRLSVGDSVSVTPSGLRKTSRGRRR